MVSKLIYQNLLTLPYIYILELENIFTLYYGGLYNILYNINLYIILQLNTMTAFNAYNIYIVLII